IDTLREKQQSMEIEKTRSEEQLKAAQKSLIEERTSFTNLKNEMENTFKSLAGDVLKDSNKNFLDLATDKFDAKQKAIDTLLDPVKLTLEKLDQKTQQLEVKREAHMKSWASSSY